MSEPMEELSPVARALLELERSRPEAPEADAAAVLARLEQTLGLPPEPTAPTQAEAPAAPASAPAGALSGGGAGALKLAAVFAAGALAGGGSLLAAQRLAAPPVPPPAKVVQVAPAPSEALRPPPPVAVETTPPPVAEQRPRKPVARPAPTPAPTPAPAPAPADSTLASERALLELARTALARGRHAEALDAVARHGREFPSGQLAEERESLWIQALVGAGQHGEARARGEAFRRDYPRSILRPAVEAVLESIP